jgi:hypothetical protein
LRGGVFMKDNPNFLSKADLERFSEISDGVGRNTKVTLRAGARILISQPKSEESRNDSETSKKQQPR